MTSASGANWRGTAFLAIANTVDPAMRAEYEAWHTFEHVPERLTMPGFMAARRYVQDRGDDQHYLTLYDLDDAEALATARYHHLLANPTTASRRMRPHMGAFRRFAYREMMRFGTGCGRHLGILRWAGSSLGTAVELSPAAAACLGGLTGTSGIVSLRLGASLETPPHPAFAADPAAQPHLIAVASGTDCAALQAALQHVERDLCGGDLSGNDIGIVLESGVYELIVAY
jgi:hypothetical protein